VKGLRLKELLMKLPSRNKSSHKHSVGTSLIIAGSQGMQGAAVLAARAAMRSGSGYVKVLTDPKAYSSLKNPDFLVTDWKKTKLSQISFDSLAIGPGIGFSPSSKKIFKEVLKLKDKKVVLDADALTLLSREKKVKLPEDWIITPHEGELAKLLGTTSSKVKENRRASVVAAQKKYNCIVVLKGHQSLIATKNQIHKNPSGNAALAKAGTGDVLTGMICGFLSQGLEPLYAARLAVYLHGYIADQWIKKNDIISLMPSDLIEMLPAQLKKIRSRK
jgi:NAD(P)H-hydrate epimerase